MDAEEATGIAFEQHPAGAGKAVQSVEIADQSKGIALVEEGQGAKELKGAEEAKGIAFVVLEEGAEGARIVSSVEEVLEEVAKADALFFEFNRGLRGTLVRARRRC